MSDTQASQLQSNVFNTTLFFEGGSMRAAYTSAVATYLLEQGIYFDNVWGVSAGSSNTVNYISRDINRTAVSFTDFIGLPQIGDVKTFLQGKGMFNAHFIYQEAGCPDGVLPFDFETFQANPAKCTVVAFERDTGKELYFTKDDMTTLDELMIRVRASSTLPVVMPSPVINGQHCYDGGFADGGGLPVHALAKEPTERFFIVRTRKRGYRREAGNKWAKWYFCRRPYIKNALLQRHVMYNAACDVIDQWEAEGKAYVFYCDELTLSGTERDVALLQQNFDAGYAQIKREWPAIQAFIEAGEK